MAAHIVLLIDRSRSYTLIFHMVLLTVYLYSTEKGDGITLYRHFSSSKLTFEHQPLWQAYVR